MNKLKVLALCHFDVIEPKGGGQIVVFNFLDKLSRYFEITLLSLNAYGSPEKEVQLSPNFRQIVIPQSYKQAKIMWDAEKKFNKELTEGLFDVIQIGYAHLNRKFFNTVKEFAAQSNVIIFEHPYLFDLVKDTAHNNIWLYHAHNHEHKLKKILLNNSPELLNRIHEIEKNVCSSCDIILSPTENEKSSLQDDYNVPDDKFIITNHGVNTSSIPFITRDEHIAYKSRYSKYINKSLILFVGSWHPPNLEALEFIIDVLAPVNKDFVYLILGSVKDYYERKYKNKTVPQNVVLLGSVDEQNKWEYYRLSDIAINPMFSGAGINVKMIEYMAAGLPIVSTVFGARGIEMSKHAVLCDGSTFYESMKGLVGNSEKQSLMIDENRLISIERYSYKNIVLGVARGIINFGLTKKIVRDDAADIYLSMLLIYEVTDELSTLLIKKKDALINTVSVELQKIITVDGANSDTIKTRIIDNLLLQNEVSPYGTKSNIIVAEEPGLIDKIIDYGISHKSIILRVPFVNRISKRIYYFMNEINRKKYLNIETKKGR